MPSTFGCRACSTRAPAEGAAPQAYDEAKVTTIKGMVEVVQLPYGAGVVADTPWAAFAARRQIGESVRWTHTGKAWGFDSDNGLEIFAAAARDPNAKATDWFKLHDTLLGRRLWPARAA